MIHFGTGGWRAVIADEFTKANIRLLIAGLCSLMHKEGHDGAEVCVGYDRRFLSKESAHWAAEVMAGYGFRPYVINRSSPTPLMMFMVKTRAMPYGIAVTASHNPAIYNGIKVFTAGGRDADRTVTDKIEAEIAQINPDTIKSMDYDAAVAAGVITEHNPTYRQHSVRHRRRGHQERAAAHCARPHVRRQPDEPEHDPHDLPLRSGDHPRPPRHALRRQASRAERGHARPASLRFSSTCLNSTPARNLKTSITSAVRTAARSISRTAAGSSVASPAPSRSCAWLPRLRQTKKPSPISRPGKPSCRSERSA